MVDVLLTGGGSGGHVTPGLAVGQVLRQQGVAVAFVGSNTGLEEALVQPTGLRYLGISAGKLRRYFSWQNLLDAFRVVLGIIQALVLIGRERPKVVFSKGGFVAFPVVFAAWVWRVPVVAHESDATQGLANLLSAPFVNTLCAGFPDTQVRSLFGPFKGRFVYTGAPIRHELLEGSVTAGRAALGVSDGKRVLLVTRRPTNSRGEAGLWRMSVARARSGQQMALVIGRSTMSHKVGLTCWRRRMWWCPGQAQTAFLSCSLWVNPTCWCPCRWRGAAAISLITRVLPKQADIVGLCHKNS